MIYLIIIIAIIYILYELKVFKKVSKQIEENLKESINITTDDLKEYAGYIKEDIFDMIQDFCKDELGKDIKLHSINKDTMSDDITLENKDFDKLKSMSGDININKCTGGNINTMSGDVDMGESKVNKAETMSGNLICIRSTANQLKTMSGSLRITNSTVIKAETLSGTITTFNSDIETLFCTEDTKLDLRLGTKINELYIMSSLTTYNGKPKEEKTVVIEIVNNDIKINNIEFLTKKPGRVKIKKDVLNIPKIINGELKIY